MAFSKPAQVVRQLALQPGMTVADFGAGSGHYTFAAASEVAPSGTVYAIEILPDLAKRIAAHGRHAGVKNVEVISGDIEAPRGAILPDGIADIVFMTNILFQIEERGRVFIEAARVLKPKGRLLLVDWTDSFGGMGPVDDQVVPARAARKLAEARGFEFVKDIPAGDHHWGMLMRKA